MFHAKHLRHVIQALLLILAIVSLAACVAPQGVGESPQAATEAGAAPASAAPAGEPVTLRFASFQSGDVVKTWEKQFAEFEAETGIKVVHEYIPWDETVTKYLTMAAANDLPDVAMVSAQWHRALAARKVLAALNQEELAGLDFGDFWPKLLAAYNYDGTQYGLPTDTDLQLVYYNKKLFDEAGVPYPEPGWTWDDYRETAKALTQGEGSGKVYGSVAPGYGQLQMIAWSYGGDFVDLATSKPAWDSEPVQKTMALYNGLLMEDQSAPLPGSEGVSISNGRIAMDIMGPWGAWYVMKDADFDWGVVPVPVGDEESVLAWGSTLAMFDASKNKEAAAKFMEFFDAPERQFQRAADWAWFPPGKAATEMEGFMDPSVLKLDPEQKQFVIDSVAYGRAPFVQEEEARLQDIFTEQMSLVTSGAISMDEGLVAIQAGWEEILK